MKGSLKTANQVKVRVGGACAALALPMGERGHWHELSYEGPGEKGKVPTTGISFTQVPGNSTSGTNSSGFFSLLTCVKDLAHWLFF